MIVSGIPNCGLVAEPENGQVTIVNRPDESFAEYSCDDGFSLVGAVTRRCLSNGSYADEAPTCEGINILARYSHHMIFLCTTVNCGELSNPSDGQVFHPITTKGGIATYNCSEGFVLNGEENRVCLGNGSWSDMEPTCDSAGKKKLTVATVE